MFFDEEKQMLKKFLLIISILALALGAVSCGGTYPAVESTDEEKSVLMTFNYDGEKYDLTYAIREQGDSDYLPCDSNLLSEWNHEDGVKQVNIR